MPLGELITEEWTVDSTGERVRSITATVPDTLPWYSSIRLRVESFLRRLTVWLGKSDD